MNEGSLGLIIEGLVSILLLATIFYCISVNRKLERLRDEQKGMHSFIRELSAATEKADKAIHGLRDTVQDSGNELAGQIDKGRNMSRQIKTEIENAKQTMNKLVVLAGSARESLETTATPSRHQESREYASSVDELRNSMLGFEDLDAENSNTSGTDGLLVGDRGVV